MKDAIRWILLVPILGAILIGSLYLNVPGQKLLFSACPLDKIEATGVASATSAGTVSSDSYLSCTAPWYLPLLKVMPFVFFLVSFTACGFVSYYLAPRYKRQVAFVSFLLPTTYIAYLFIR